MINCIICNAEHDRLWGDLEAMYCAACAKIKGDAEGTLTHVTGTLYLGDETAGSLFDGERLCVYDTPPEYSGDHIHIPILTKKPSSATDRTGATASPEQLDRAAAWIEGAIHLEKELIVHCKGGVERSPLTIAWWLVKSGRYDSMEKAYAFLKEIRPVVSPRLFWLPDDVQKALNPI